VLVGRASIANSLSFAFWLQPFSLIWLVAVIDVLDKSSLLLLMGTFAQRDTELGYQLTSFSSRFSD
jgi:hypothetical protein